MGNKILPNIPAMWYGNPSAVCYIGAVMRLMEYIGDPVEQDELIALCGVGLSFPWGYDSCCDEVSLLPEIPARTFDAFGYESEHISGDAVNDKAACFEKIKQSIDRNRPVIGFGITTKMPMSCLIVGYDDNGLYTRSCWAPNGEKYDSTECCQSEEYFYSADWHENCSGLLIVGEKTGERVAGVAAYERIITWARNFRWERNHRGYEYPIVADGKEIYVNGHAFEKMSEWLRDDEQWQNPNGGGKEQYLKQCGILLFGYYRNNLYSYLKKLEAQNPGMVHPPVFTALELINKSIPGAHTSDLWLHEAVDPVMKDFSALSDRVLRDKLDGYVQLLGGFDNSVQWTLFMPDVVKDQTKDFKVENFEYRTCPAMRFIGAEGEEYSDVERRGEIFRVLDGMSEYKSGFDHDILFMHHYGLSADNPWHGVWGRFMTADAPVPEGFLSFDFVPHDVEEANVPYYFPGIGPPYDSRCAFATFSGDAEVLHKREGYDSDAMYDVTRNIILGDGVNIPYPERYWTAEVFFDGCDKPGSGYLFSVGDWQTTLQG